MFGGFGGFEDDPFFREHNQSMRRHNDVMRNMMAPFGDPFGMMMPHQHHATGPAQHNSHRGQGQGGYTGQQDLSLAPMNSFNDMFRNMSQMMNQNFAAMNQQAMNGHSAPAGPNGNSHCYSSSTVMSYSNDGRGAPKVYRSSTSTRHAPGGIKETRKSLRDSESGVNKISVGHHLGERSHIQEKVKNTRTGEEEQRQEFMNLDETDAEEFGREWQQRTMQPTQQSLGYGGRHRNPRDHVLPYQSITNGGNDEDRPTARHGARAQVFERDRDDEREKDIKKQQKRVRLNSRPTDTF